MKPCRATSNTEISAIKMATSPSCLAYFKEKNAKSFLFTTLR